MLREGNMQENLEENSVNKGTKFVDIRFVGNKLMNFLRGRQNCGAMEWLSPWKGLFRKTGHMKGKLN